jgi:hypothetical protein
MRIGAQRSFGRERTNGREGERIFHAAQRSYAPQPDPSEGACIMHRIKNGFTLGSRFAAVGGGNFHELLWSSPLAKLLGHYGSCNFHREAPPPPTPERPHPQPDPMDRIPGTFRLLIYAPLWFRQVGWGRSLQRASAFLSRVACGGFE